MLTAVVVGFIVIGIAGIVWRVWFAMNHPEMRTCSMNRPCKWKKEDIEKLTAAARKGFVIALKKRQGLK